MTFFRHLLSPEKCFSTQNFPNLHQIFSDDLFIVGLICRKNCLSIQAILKRNFHRNFPKDLLVSFYQKKIFSPPNFLEKCFGLRDLYAFLLFLAKRSRYSMIYYNYDTAILTYNIIHSSIFISWYAGTPYRRVLSQKALTNTNNNYDDEDDDDDDDDDDG